MKREIKLRGKCIDNGLWEIGWLYRHDDVYYIKDGVNDTVAPFRIDPATVGQYTGLKDKNGVEIYEGDIVEMEQWRPSLAEVCFDDGAFCLRQEGIPYMSDIHYVHHAGLPQATVIGNIHDNPSLLKGGEEYA